MNKLLLNGKKALSITAGIIFTGLLIKTIDDQIPVNLIQKDFAGYINNESEISYNNSEVIEKIVTEESKIKDVPIPEKVIDKRVTEIETYLNKRNSPLAKYAEEFVKAADEYKIDYRLVASISVIESSAGLHCFKPYNAWGWGNMTFDNWTDGIWTVSEGLGKYYQNGLTTPNLIAPHYCPPSATSWSNKVNYVMNQISE